MADNFYSHVMRLGDADLRDSGVIHDVLDEKTSDISRQFLEYYKSFLKKGISRDIDIIDFPSIKDSFLISCDENLDNIKVHLSKTAFLGHIFENDWSWNALREDAYVRDYDRTVEYLYRDEFCINVTKLTCDMRYWQKRELFSSRYYGKYLENEGILREEAKRIYRSFKKEVRSTKKKNLPAEILIATIVVQLEAVSENIYPLCDFIDQTEAIDVLNLEGIAPDKVRLHLADLMINTVMSQRDKSYISDSYCERVDASLNNYFNQMIQEGKTDVYYKLNNSKRTFDRVYNEYLKYHTDKKDEKPKIYVKKD